jgi:hypothetical protein
MNRMKIGDLSIGFLKNLYVICGNKEVENTDISRQAFSDQEIGIFLWLNHTY